LDAALGAQGELNLGPFQSHVIKRKEDSSRTTPFRFLHETLDHPIEFKPIFWKRVADAKARFRELISKGAKEFGNAQFSCKATNYFARFLLHYFAYPARQQ
jgi:hypothetical protein